MRDQRLKRNFVDLDEAASNNLCCLQIQLVLSFALKMVNSLSTRKEIAEFANSMDLNEVAHDELPHPDLKCLPCSL